MFVELSFENFQRITIETNTGLIFLKEMPQEDGTCKFEFFTNSNSFWVRTMYQTMSVEETLIFRERYVIGAKVIPIIGTSNEKVNLTITQG